MTERCWKIVRRLLILGSVLAAIKLIFVDYTLDEEYQIVMAYRRLKGDTLFGTMWEPHQTSSFACFYLMKLYHFITGGTDGVVLFIRICTTLIQAGLSFGLYRTLKNRIRDEYAFLMGLVFFNYVPKMIEIPEFSNLQLWFFMITVLTIGAYERYRRCYWIVLAGIAMSLEVLAYPSCLVLFPFFLLYLYVAGRHRETDAHPVRDGAIFAVTCGVCGGVWMLYILTKVSLTEFLNNLGHILTFDSTHSLDISGQTKGITLLAETKESLILMVICLTVSGTAYWIGKQFFQKRMELPILLIVTAEMIQIIYWVVLRTGYERPQIMMLILLLMPLYEGFRRKRIAPGYLCGYIGSWVAVGAVLYMSDLGLWNALAIGILGGIYALAMLVEDVDTDVQSRNCGIETEREGKASDPAEKQGKRDNENTHKCMMGGRMSVWLLLISLCITGIFGKGFTVKVGKTQTNTILGVQNVIRKGPAMGIFTHYMLACIMNSDYEDFLNNVTPGTKCLIVTNMVEGAGTSPYMFADYQISHFSIVDPTTYDEKLLTYWKEYPEKEPDVIIVDCWYGQLMEEPDNWIMRYIEEDFGYTEVVDGKYVRFYKR